MNKILGSIVLILVVVGVIWWASSKPAVAPVSGEPIKIGVIAPFSGVRSDAGEFTRNGLTLAEGEIFANDSLRFKLQFVYEDSKYEPPVAVSAFHKLVDLDQIHYVIGPYGSSEVLAVAPVAEQSKVLLIVPGAQSDEISQAGDYIFRLIHNSAQEAPMFATFVAEKMKSDTLHFLAISTAITDPYLKNFRPVLESKGKKIGLIEKFDSKTTDFRTELAKIKAQKPTDIFLISTPKGVALILKQAKDLGIEAQFYNIGVEGPELIKEAGALAEGLLYPYSYNNHSEDKSVKSFNDKYVARFNAEPDTLAANAYDAAYLLSNCFEKNGENVEKVKDCFYQVKDFSGASGTFSIDRNGDAIKNLLIKTVKNGQFVKL